MQFLHYTANILKSWVKSDTNKDPHLVHPSICLQNLLLEVKATPVASFINNLLRISLEHICGSTFGTYIWSNMLLTIHSKGMLMNSGSKS